MAKTMSGNPNEPAKQETASLPLFDPGELAKFGTRNFERATRAARAYYNGVSQLNQEMASFVKARVRKDIETAKAFMETKDGESALHTSAEFFEGAIRDYADETSRILHLAADMAHETLAPVEMRAQETPLTSDESADPAEQKPTAAK